MPTASRESSRSRRSNSKTSSPPPQKGPPSKKVNGVKSSLTPKSTKDPKLLDILSDTECKLCERKNFKLGSETLGKGSLYGWGRSEMFDFWLLIEINFGFFLNRWLNFFSVKHYALEHFKDTLESELGPHNSKDFGCSICKSKKLKSKFDSRQELLLHNAGFHLRAQVLLSEALGDNSNDCNSSNSSSSTTRGGSRTRNRAKQKSEDSVIEIESNSGSSIGSQNGLEELSKGSEASDNTETIDLDEEEDGEDDKEEEGDEVDVEEEVEEINNKDFESKNQVMKTKKSYIIYYIFLFTGSKVFQCTKKVFRKIRN